MFRWSFAEPKNRASLFILCHTSGLARRYYTERFFTVRTTFLNPRRLSLKLMSYSGLGRARAVILWGRATRKKMLTYHERLRQTNNLWEKRTPFSGNSQVKRNRSKRAGPCNTPWKSQRIWWLLFRRSRSAEMPKPMICVMLDCSRNQNSVLFVDPLIWGDSA